MIASPSAAPATVLIVGAGIIGAALAYRLAAAGARVSVLDSGSAGHGATRHSFGWIGRSPEGDTPHADLRARGSEEWDVLAREVPGLIVERSGALVWGEYFSRPGARPEPTASLHEPALLNPPARAEHRAGDGSVDPLRATEALLAAARGHGARVLPGTPVTRVLRDAAGVARGVEAHGKPLYADTVIIAAGTGSPALCATAGVEMNLTPAPAVMVRLNAPPGLLRGIIACDEAEARQYPDGTVLMPRDYEGEIDAADLERSGRAAAEYFRSALRGADHTQWLDTTIGWRPMPAGGEPYLGFSSTPGLYLAVAHPGIMLAPAIALRAVADILGTRAS
ncbi:NAD(P)/FAD-dependent oxidoreductase [Mycetocola spongiae]|uniref:NAD(P)/FAD-dependent oxidoreductase n=1 Tax=Mycetocola spongiae TaxID=2859226 RepID=UPI001CF5F050|nr:FAD-dependent oxidoreductase [Mycetocola spongiae]UCR89105.1 FAD-binding oxidoreductase [Mycetocola spongiae]